MQVDSRTTNVTVGMKAMLLTVSLLVTALATVSSGQSPRGTLLESGLHSFPPRHTARVTVAEIGRGAVASRVAIELRDAEDKVVARTTGVLRRGQPVQLDFQITDALLQLRATVAVAGVFGTSSRPTTTVEDIDVDAFAVVPKVVCGPPSGRSDPQFSCPGWEVTSFVQ